VSETLASRSDGGMATSRNFDQPGNWVMSAQRFGVKYNY
jgi:hypothetical protein